MREKRCGQSLPLPPFSLCHTHTHTRQKTRSNPPTTDWCELPNQIPGPQLPFWPGMELEPNNQRWNGCVCECASVCVCTKPNGTDKLKDPHTQSRPQAKDILARGFFFASPRRSTGRKRKAQRPAKSGKEAHTSKQTK